MSLSSVKNNYSPIPTGPTIEWDDSNQLMKGEGEAKEYIFSKMSSVSVQFSGSKSKRENITFNVNRGNRKLKAHFAAFINRDGEIVIKHKPFEHWPKSWTWNTAKSRFLTAICRSGDNAEALKERRNNALLLGKLCKRPFDEPCYLNFGAVGQGGSVELREQHNKTYSGTMNFNKSQEQSSLIIENEPTQAHKKCRWGVKDCTEIKTNKPIDLVRNKHMQGVEPNEIRIIPSVLCKEEHSALKFTIKHNSDGTGILLIEEVSPLKHTF